MSDDNVVQLASPRMTDADYERERQHIRDLYGDTKTDAGTKWEQALAKLFFQSGWTQAELAAKEGKSQTWINFRLRFGRFLSFSENITAGNNSRIITERRFREYWEKTEGSNERRRFRDVLDMIGSAQHQPMPKNNALMRAIRDNFTDGKWHTSEAIARKAENTVEAVDTILGGVAGRSDRRNKVERRRIGRGFQYRMYPAERMISSAELTDKLVPLIGELKAEGRKNMATIAISRIAKIAAELQELLDEWTQ